MLEEHTFPIGTGNIPLPEEKIKELRTSYITKNTLSILRKDTNIHGGVDPEGKIFQILDRVVTLKKQVRFVYSED